MKRVIKKLKALWDLASKEVEREERLRRREVLTLGDPEPHIFQPQKGRIAPKKI